LRSSQVSNIKTAVFKTFHNTLPLINNNSKPATISAWKRNPAVLECFKKLYELTDQNNEESDTYMAQIVKQAWPKKQKPSELHLAWAASVAEVFLDPDNDHIKLSETIMKPILKKNIVKYN
jgi:hypothetical protein